jgi:hypothetical protein
MTITTQNTITEKPIEKKPIEEKPLIKLKTKYPIIVKKEIVIKIARKPRILDEISNDATCNLGSYFKNGRNVGTGLTEEEKISLLPDILNIPATDPSFRKNLEEYFIEQDIKVDPVKGLVLNIGYDIIGIDEDGKDIIRPHNVFDYVHYKWAIDNPKVASSFELTKLGYDVYNFYVEDKGKALEERKKLANIKQEANKQFLELTYGDKAFDNKDKIEWIFFLTKEEHGDFGKSSTLDEKVMVIQELIENKPETFLEKIKDSNLETKVFILKCIEFNVLKKVGNSIFNIDEEIGRDIDEAVLYLKSASNSAVYVKLKAKLEAQSR